MEIRRDRYLKRLVSSIKKRWYDETGILNIGIIDFLTDENLL